MPKFASEIKKTTCQISKNQKRMKRKILYVGTFAELARFVELQVSDGYRVDDDDEEEMAYV
jgi:uncharacterized protein YggL (DUF469 family)